MSKMHFIRKSRLDKLGGTSFLESGTWTLLIDGEKTQRFKNG
ncbi:hypothetical protein V6B14_18280 [Sporosarcina psychrophila]